MRGAHRLRSRRSLRREPRLRLRDPGDDRGHGAHRRSRRRRRPRPAIRPSTTPPASWRRWACSRRSSKEGRPGRRLDARRDAVAAELPGRSRAQRRRSRPSGSPISHPYMVPAQIFPTARRLARRCSSPTTSSGRSSATRSAARNGAATSASPPWQAAAQNREPVLAEIATLLRKAGRSDWVRSPGPPRRRRIAEVEHAGARPWTARSCANARWWPRSRASTDAPGRRQPDQVRRFAPSYARPPLLDEHHDEVVTGTGASDARAAREPTPKAQSGPDPRDGRLGRGRAAQLPRQHAQHARRIGAHRSAGCRQEHPDRSARSCTRCEGPAHRRAGGRPEQPESARRHPRRPRAHGRTGRAAGAVHPLDRIALDVGRPLGQPAGDAGH